MGIVVDVNIVRLPVLFKAIEIDALLVVLTHIITNNHVPVLLLHDAAKLVTQNQQASVSLLQRKFRIGYSRAGRLIDELESLGIVSGYSGSKAREVLVDESYLENIFNE